MLSVCVPAELIGGRWLLPVRVDGLPVLLELKNMHFVGFPALEILHFVGNTAVKILHFVDNGTKLFLHFGVYSIKTPGR